MIELRRIPAHIAMACLAIGWESERGMGRICGGVKILYVTVITLLRHAPILRRMAAGAVSAGMFASKSEFPYVPKTGNSPTGRNRLMALLAIAGKTSQGMAGIIGGFKIGLMANLAFLRDAREFVPLLADMAGAAVGDGMNSHQWESSRRMKFEIVFAILPILWRMAILAGRPELTAMNIGMTVGAGRTDISETKVPMADPAGGLGVLPHQRKSGYLVIEF
jgi:hypothetical protein